MVYLRDVLLLVSLFLAIPPIPSERVMERDFSILTIVESLFIFSLFLYLSLRAKSMNKKSVLLLFVGYCIFLIGLNLRCTY